MQDTLPFDITPGTLAIPGTTATPRKTGYANRVYKQRQCEDCPLIYVPRSSQQKRCGDCQYQYQLKLGRDKAAAARKAAYKPRFCADCETELPAPNGRARPRGRCEPCAVARIVAHDKARNKQRSADGSRKVYDARWRDSHREEINEANRQYKRLHPESDEASNARRRQRVTAGMTAEDRMLSRFYRLATKRDPCFYCGAPAPAGKPHEIDHFIPLKKGGTDHWWNLARSCQRCNRGPAGKHSRCGTAFMLRSLSGWRHF
jgi:5-methylcytosine-specific restriction endonuclease McrA